MERKVLHDRSEESDEAKAAWFQSLPLEERMELFCEFTDLVLENNPDLIENLHAEPIAGRVQIIELP